MNPDELCGPSPSDKWLIALAVMGVTVMEILDGTVVNVSLPHIAGTLGADVHQTTWILTSYDVSSAVVMPIAAWLATFFGRRRLLMFCMVVFAGSSLLCGVAPNLEYLIFFRVLQGLGGGALQPISMAILLETFPVRERGMAMGIWGMGVVLAPICGPLLGGWLSDNLTWRWIFYVNLPICLLSLTLTMLYIHDPPYIRSQRPERIDYLGLGLLCVGMGALQVLLDKGQLEDWFSSGYICQLTAIAAIALIALIYRELTTEHPIIDLRLFKDRNYADGMTIVFIVTIVRSGSILLLPLFLQKLMGYDASTAGWALAFSGIGALLFSPVVGRMTSIIDSRVLLGVGLALNAYAVYLFGNFNTHIDFNLAWFPRLIQGFGSAATIVSLATLTMCCIPKDRMGNATGIYNMIGNLGSGFGVAVATTYLARRAQFHQNRMVEHLTPHSLPFSAWQERLAELFQSPGDYWDIWESRESLNQLYTQMQNQAWMKSFCDIYWIYTMIFVALIPLVFLMTRESPPIQCPPEGPRHEIQGS